MEPDSPFKDFCLKHLQPICEIFLEERVKTDKKVCYCKLSKCKKGYCQCFSQGRLCDGCGCTSCHNTIKHSKGGLLGKKAKITEN